MRARTAEVVEHSAVSQMPNQVGLVYIYVIAPPYHVEKLYALRQPSSIVLCEIVCHSRCVTELFCVIFCKFTNKWVQNKI